MPDSHFAIRTTRQSAPLPGEVLVNSSILLAVAIAPGWNALGQSTHTLPQTPRVSSPSRDQVHFTSRNIEAVNYAHPGGSTQMDFAGTHLIPAANGNVKMVGTKDSLKINAKFGNLQSP